MEIIQYPENINLGKKIHHFCCIIIGVTLRIRTIQIGKQTPYKNTGGRNILIGMQGGMINNFNRIIRNVVCLI